MKDVKITVIKNEEQYRNYLKRIEEIFDAKPGTPDGDELELLSLLVEKYEEEKYSPITLDPVDVIKVRMEDLNLNQNDLVPAIGHKGNVSQVLNRKRNLTIEQIRKLASILKVPIELLIGKPIEVTT